LQPGAEHEHPHALRGEGTRRVKPAI
jgi:hypothetical protein